jgi:hypothetical protein
MSDALPPLEVHEGESWRLELVPAFSVDSE